jgi:hypothetical protein
MVALALALGALALGLAACGGDGGKKNGSSTPKTLATAPGGAPLATAPSATAPPPDATSPPPSVPKTVPGGSEPVRIDATFTLRNGRLTPPTVSTPAFLAVQVSVRNADAVAHVVVVRTGREFRLAVGPRRRVTRLVGGQRAGTYPVLVDGRRRGALVFGGEPGP